MKTSTSCLRLVFGLLFVSVFSAKADLVVYSDRAAWEASGGIVQHITFAGLAGGSGDQSYSGGLLVDGVSFVGGTWGGSSYLYVRNTPDFLYGPADDSLGCPLAQLGANPACDLAAGIVVTLPAAVTSIGWEFGNFYLPGVTVRFPDGVTVSDTAFSGFIGFTSHDPFTNFEIDSAGFPIVGNFSFDPASVPEPRSFLLLLTVFALFAGLHRFRRMGQLPPARS